MDWVTGLNRALDYIENHITEKLNYDEIAHECFYSSYHFQRVFSILCGYTLGDYIRYRRLTLAGKDIKLSNMKVVDVALKYGYESPDGFTKAFVKFHGITPTEASKPDSVLQSFTPLKIKVSLSGGNTMEYRIEKNRNSNYLVIKSILQVYLLESKEISKKKKYLCRLVLISGCYREYRMICIPIIAL